MDNEIAIQTLRWFVPLVAGPLKIANNTGGAKILTKSVEDGYSAVPYVPGLAH